MKKILIIVSVLVGVTTLAQTPIFTEVSTPIPDLVDSYYEFADFNGDTHLDLIIIGDESAYPSSDPFTALYINDGFGNYTLKSNSFTQFLYGCIGISDLNGDTHLDLILSGEMESGNSACEIYYNDGTGSFSSVTNTVFPIVENGRIIFFDADGDLDDDVLFTGRDGFNRVGELFIRQADNSFINSGENIRGVRGLGVGVFQADDNTSPDIFVAGSDGCCSYANMFYNDGLGGYSAPSTTDFIEVQSALFDYIDIDGDDDIDVYLSGWIGFEGHEPGLYENDGDGSFVAIDNAELDSLADGGAVFFDADNDGDNDLLVSGENNQDEHITSLYLNDGDGDFIKYLNLTLPQIKRGYVEAADIDGDGDEDFLLTGRNYDDDVSFTRLYRNDSPVASIEEGLLTSTKIYPNPTSSIINVQSDYLIQSIEIVNSFGNVVLKSQSETVNLSDLSSGVYILKIEIEGRLIARRITKV